MAESSHPLPESPAHQSGAARSDDYIVVDPCVLQHDTDYHFPIYLYSETRKRFVLFKNTDDAIPPQRLAQLVSEGRQSIYVPRSHSATMTHALSENLNSVVIDSNASVEEKSKSIYALSHTVMQNLFDSPPDNKQFIEISANVSDAVADLMLSEPDAVDQLTALRSYDYYTFSHSMNVCVMALALYRYMNPNESELSVRDISRGMLLHDIGKCDVPTQLTNKKGKLSDQEWDVMKSHTVKGYERLGMDEQMSGDSRTVSLMHHEALDGSGYPTGKGGPGIPFLSRLCKVIDVYDALTSRRSYKGALKPFEALQLMSSEMKSHLDPDILKHFILFLDHMNKRRG